MRPSSSTWIEQQMYTRERRGIFRTNEGYDTVAVSKGLDPNMVKKVLHPFCTYDAPAELSVSGEKDGSLYPESIHLYHTEQGASVLGRSIYQAQDFTGLRSAFFTHHYVIPAERSEDVVNGFRQWLHADYADHYDIEEGTELAQLRDIPVKPAAQVQPLELLSELKIDERIFKQLLFALTNAATGRKKVYVALDVPIDKLSAYAARLLEVLFQSLPYAYRRMLGFMTYSKEPESKKGIHVMFVEKGSLRANDRNIEREYIFDLAAGRMMNVDIELEHQPYLEFAWKHLNDIDALEAFYRYADQLLIGTEQHKQIALISYHELSIFYQLEQGDYTLYEEHKQPVLRALLGHMAQGEMTTAKQRLHALFARLEELELENVKQGALPEPDLLDGFKDYLYQEQVTERGKAQLIPLFIHSIHQAAVQSNHALSSRYYAIVASHPELSRVFFDTVLNRGLAQSLFEPYVAKQFQEAPRAGDIVDLVCDWGTRHTQVLKLASFRAMAQEALIQKLRKENEPVKIANAILEQLHRLPRGRDEEIELADSELMDTLIYAVNCFLLLESDLKRISKQELLQIGFLQQPKQFIQWARRFDDHVQSKAEKMVALYDWFHASAPEVFVFERLSQEELEETQQIGLRLLQQELSEGQFARLVLAFYRDTESRQVEYGALLQFLHQSAKNKEVIYQFFQWSEDHHDFVRSKKPSPAYAAALLNYFKKYDREAFKHRTYRKHYFETSSVLGPVYQKAKVELSSPLMRLLARNKRALFSLVAIIIVVGGALLALQATGIMGADGKKEANPPIGQGDQTTNVKPEIPVSSTPVTTGVIRTPVDGAEKEVTVLTFFFASQTEADGFTPESIILDPGSAQQTLAILKREPSLEQNPLEGADEQQGDASESGGQGKASDQGDQNEEADPLNSSEQADTPADSDTDKQQSQKDGGKTPSESTGPFEVRILLTDKHDIKAGTVIQAQEKKFTIKDQV